MANARIPVGGATDRTGLASAPLALDPCPHTVSYTHLGEEAGLLSCYVDCVTDTDHVLTCHYPRKDTPFCKAGAPHNTDLYMKGSAVMRFAVKALAKAVRAAAAEAGVAVEDIAYFVPHQANLQMCIRDSSEAALF